MSIIAAEDGISPSDFYARRSDELRIATIEAASRYSRYTQGLIILGLLACVTLYQSVVAKRLPLWATFLVIPAAALVVQQRHRCQRKYLELRSLAEYYAKANARLTRKWELLDGGDRFIDHDHFYSRDLDLFGRGSLFQLLCSARTQIGRETLANWMLMPANIEEIHARQAALQELRLRRELPELLAAAGAELAPDFRPDFFKAWATSSMSRFPAWAPLLAFFLALTVIALPIFYWSGFLTLHALSVNLGTLFCVEAILATAFRSRVKSVLESLGTLSVELPTLCELLRIMEREQFASAKLRALAGCLAQRSRPASHKLGRLRRLILLMTQRENEWFAHVSYCLLWGTQFAMAIERWRSLHGTQLLDWLEALGEFEALISLSTYAYEHPADTLPELDLQGPVFEAEGLGHPLLEESSCVRNNLHLGEMPRFLIVSGSNMSGKSTFLRAIGLNAVLAYMGAPVRCVKLRLSPLTIAAAVRIQDSVVDGRSHFLAEMYRLRRMIETAGHGPLLFLADEIMGGTNSHDRRIASEWVIRALMLRGAIGAITTHDLALTEIAANGLPGRNVCFEDSGEFGSLSFDYKLRQGVLRRSNALNIAHLLGIDAAAEEQ